MFARALSIKRAPKHRKEAIPKALREQVWLQYGGPQFYKKCSVAWCTNQVSAFQFHVGHNIAEAKGGPTELSNLRVICASCNLSMGTKSIDEWSKSVIRTTDTPYPVKPVKRAAMPPAPVVQNESSFKLCCF
jgi:5-methylcytosine-specific restriction endonuclease McrA